MDLYWRYFVRGVQASYRFRVLSRRYRALFCTSDYLYQIEKFRGPVFVDDDDPVFTDTHLDRLNRPKVRVVVTTSEMLRRTLLEAGLRKPCHVIPSGVDLGRLDESRVEQVSRQLGKASSDVVVGCAIPFLYTDGDPQMRRSEEAKVQSVSFLLSAMERVWCIVPAAQLWLIGHPSDSVRAYAAREPRTRLLDYVPHDQLLDYVAQFDIATYPRLTDLRGRHSIKLLEYMACGCPIVSTTVSESYLVQQAGAGLVAADLDGFARNMVALLNSPEQRRKLGRAGRRFVQDYGWDALAERYEREIFSSYLVGEE
jgi:glycosyltransferase involved in cell wall biosynthesis